jgi:hypothetical protein
MRPGHLRPNTTQLDNLPAGGVRTGLHIKDSRLILHRAAVIAAIYCIVNSNINLIIILNINSQVFRFKVLQRFILVVAWFHR